jgi:hypothetical protein
MNRTSEVGLKLGAVLVFVGVVVAQQPPVTGESRSLSTRVFDQVRNLVSGPPPQERPSLREILRRYDAVVKAAQDSAASTPPQAKKPIVKGKQAKATPKESGRSTPSPGVPQPPASDNEKLRAIIKELRAVVARLESVFEER